MNTVFANSFYYFALLSPSDTAHKRTMDWTAGYDGKILTTAWILTELADGMSHPVDRKACIELIRGLREDKQITILGPDKELFEAGLHLYANRLDKEWSLTDCISFIAMEREGITEALTGDHHYSQNGFVTLLSNK